MENNLSLRERKKYLTMSSILDRFLSALETKSFDQIYIEEICNSVNISKVTFFRYFDSKEEVLDYFVMRWCYQRSVEISNGIYSGMEGIRHVFKSAAEIPNGEKILVSLIHYYSKLKEKQKEKELSEYERLNISQNLSESLDIKMLSLEEIFHFYLNQIEYIHECKKESIINHLIALFYGMPFQVHMKKLSSQRLLDSYMDSLDMVFATGKMI